VRVLSSEEILAQKALEIPFLQVPDLRRIFAERAMRMRQLAAQSSLGDFLRFLAVLAQAQHDLAQHYPPLVLIDEAEAARLQRVAGVPFVASEWYRDPVWRLNLLELGDRCVSDAPAALRDAIGGLRTQSNIWIEAQADLVLAGSQRGLDLALAPLIGAALQLHFTVLLAQWEAASKAKPALGAAIGRTLFEGHCPACTSLPTSSITLAVGPSAGHRYLHCSLCNARWHMPRNKCAHCFRTDDLRYEALELADAGQDSREEPDSTGVGRRPAVLAEACGHCLHYLKILHTDRDPFVDPLADDLYSLSLDLLLGEEGFERYGNNLMLHLARPEDP
jgi:FdhE protein